MGRGPVSTSTTQARLQIAASGAPAYDPRPPTDSTLHAEVQFWFFFNFFNAVCFTL